MNQLAAPLVTAGRISEESNTMQLTRHADYALRLLIQLAGQPGERVSIASVAEEQGISHSHLMKVANELAHAGFIEAVRGRGGGISLKGSPADINIGAVVAAMEPHCSLVDCTECRLVRRCGLPGVLNEGMAAFRQVLSRYTLADIVR